MNNKVTALSLELPGELYQRCFNLQILLFGAKPVTSCVGRLQSWCPSHEAGQSHQQCSASYRKVPPFWQTIATPSAAHGGGPSTDGWLLSHGLPITGEKNNDIAVYKCRISIWVSPNKGMAATMIAGPFEFWHQCRLFLGNFLFLYRVLKNKMIQYLNLIPKWKLAAVYIIWVWWLLAISPKTLSLCNKVPPTSTTPSQRYPDEWW